MKTCAKKGRNFNWIGLAAFMCADAGGNISPKKRRHIQFFKINGDGLMPAVEVKKFSGRAALK
jgi:hypothetical protein